MVLSIVTQSTTMKFVVIASLLTLVSGGERSATIIILQNKIAR